MSTLVEIMEDKGPPEQARIKAAVSILELADKGTQPEMVDRRLQDPSERVLDDLKTSDNPRRIATLQRLERRT